MTEFLLFLLHISLVANIAMLKFIFDGNKEAKEREARIRSLEAR